MYEECFRLDPQFGPNVLDKDKQAEISEILRNTIKLNSNSDYDKCEEISSSINTNDKFKRYSFGYLDEDNENLNTSELITFIKLIKCQPIKIL